MFWTQYERGPVDWEIVENSSTFNKCLSGIIGGAVVGLLVSFAFRKEVVSQNLEEDNQRNYISASTAICPFCHEEIHPDAVLCKHCRSDLSIKKPIIKKENINILREFDSQQKSFLTTYLQNKNTKFFYLSPSFWQ